MSIYHWILIAGFGICCFVCLFYIYRLIKTGNRPDPAKPRGGIGKAVGFAFTGAMSPVKKESASLHLPTYFAGILYHLGTMLSFLLLIFNFFNLYLVYIWINYLLFAFLLLTFICGSGLLIKRFLNNKLQNISNIDDYFSNILVDGFQFLSAITLLYQKLRPLLFLYAALLFLYIPMGKLKHVIYFFSSRIHLAIFYGRRGVWPVRKQRV